MKKHILIYIILCCSNSLFGQMDSNFLENLSHGGNNKRFRTISQYILSDTSLRKYYKKESIDWLGIYKNIIINIPGNIDSTVYIMCHYDKIDGNIISGLNGLLNGYFDILLSPTYFSKGLYDNGTGTWIALQLAKKVAIKKNKYTYVFLFTGQEEYGLRGARAHVARLPLAKYNTIKYVINIDMVSNSEIGISHDVSHPVLVNWVKEITQSRGLTLRFENIKKSSGTSDFVAFTGTSWIKDFSRSFQFNLIGAFFPQRSYFTRKKKPIPLISFSDKFKISASEIISGFSPFAFGKIHSFRDNGMYINDEGLENYLFVINQLIEKIEKG